MTTATCGIDRTRVATSSLNPISGVICHVGGYCTANHISTRTQGTCTRNRSARRPYSSASISSVRTSTSTINTRTTRTAGVGGGGRTASRPKPIPGYWRNVESLLSELEDWIDMIQALDSIYIEFHQPQERKKNGT
jgi:hypothetical protein